MRDLESGNWKVGFGSTFWSFPYSNSYILISNTCGQPVASSPYNLGTIVAGCAHGGVGTIAGWAQLTTNAQFVQVLSSALSTYILQISYLLNELLSTLYTGLTKETTKYIT